MGTDLPGGTDMKIPVYIDPERIRTYWIRSNEGGTYDVDIETDEIEVSIKNVIVQFNTSTTEDNYIIPTLLKNKE